MWTRKIWAIYSYQNLKKSLGQSGRVVNNLIWSSTFKNSCAKSSLIRLWLQCFLKIEWCPCSPVNSARLLKILNNFSNSVIRVSACNQGVPTVNVKTWNGHHGYQLLSWLPAIKPGNYSTVSNVFTLRLSATFVCSVISQDYIILYCSLKLGMYWMCVRSGADTGRSDK